MAFAFSVVAIGFIVGAAPAGCDPGNPGAGGPSCSTDPDPDTDNGHGNNPPISTTGTTGTTGSTGTTGGTTSSTSSSGGAGGGGGVGATDQTLGQPPSLPPGQQGPPPPTGPPGPPPFSGGDGGAGDQNVAPGLSLSNLLWPLLAFAGVAFATIFGMNRGAAVRVHFQHAMSTPAAEAWVELFDPIEGELLMTFPVTQVIEELEPEAAPAGVLGAPQPYWEGAFDVNRQGRFHALLRYVTPEARMEVIELGLFELQGDNLLFGPELEPATAPSIGLGEVPPPGAIMAPAEPILQLEEEILAA